MTESPADPPAAAPSFGDYQRDYLQRYPGQAETQRPYGVTAGSAATPDGQPLAGWWWRVLARLIDLVVLVPVSFLATIPVMIWKRDDFTGYVSQVMNATDHSPPATSAPSALDGAPEVVLVVSVLAVALLYEIGFLRWKGATPGKLLAGIRVRRRARPGLSWPAILLRAALVVGLTRLGDLPAPVGTPFGILALLDVLWPLWDPRKQALHDKVARTNVITLR